MRKRIASLFLCSCLFLSLPSLWAQESSAPETPPSPNLNYSEMGVTELLSILSSDLDWWNETSQNHEAAMKRVLELLRTESAQRQLDLQYMSEIKQLLQQSESRLESSKLATATLGRKNSTLKVVGSVLSVALGTSIGLSVHGLDGAVIGIFVGAVSGLSIVLFL